MWEVDGASWVGACGLCSLVSGEATDLEVMSKKLQYGFTPVKTSLRSPPPAAGVHHTRGDPTT